MELILKKAMLKLFEMLNLNGANLNLTVQNVFLKEKKKKC